MLRHALPCFELDPITGAVGSRSTLLADRSKADLEGYFAEHKLPRHPLEAPGYSSIGCVPCTTTDDPGEDRRSGR